MVKPSLSEEKIREKHDKYNRPENCENLINTRVNPEIWSKVRSNTRSRDLKIQKLETSLLKSMIPIVKMSDKLVELKSNSNSVSESDVSEFLQLSLDSLALMGHSINEVNVKRRELIKPDLNSQFKQLSGSHTPVTKLLFGDDLPKPVKEISETIKVGVKVPSKPPTHYNKQKRSNFSHHTHHQSQNLFFMEIPRAREEITPGPQKEGQTRSTLTFAKPQDHPHFQVSLANDIYQNSSVNVPYVAGRLKQFVSVWQTITSDYSILSSIKGVKIEFVDYLKQTMIPREYNFDATEVVIIDKQIEKFLQIGVIETIHCEGEYISNIFIWPKKDGSYRLILNLRYVNQFVQYHHFKMENLKSAITLMSPNCYMASIDLKDAYYSVSIDTNHRKYLRFTWENQLFQFTCLPNGLSSAPRIVTKLMKPAYSTLYCEGFENVGYIDDTFLKASTSHDCEISVSSTVKLFTDLGLTLNMAKSVLIPSQSVTFLGFVLNSAQMTVSLTPFKSHEGKIKGS